MMGMPSSSPYPIVCFIPNLMNVAHVYEILGNEYIATTPFYYIKNSYIIPPKNEHPK